VKVEEFVLVMTKDGLYFFAQFDFGAKNFEYLFEHPYLVSIICGASWDRQIMKIITDILSAPLGPLGARQGLQVVGELRSGGGPPVVAAEAGDLTRDAFAQAEWEEHCPAKSLASRCGGWGRPPAGPLLAAPVLRHTPLGWEPPRGLGWAWSLGLQGHKSVGLTPFVPCTLRGSGETPAAKIRLFCLVQPPSNRVQSRSKPDISLVVAINLAMPWRKRLPLYFNFLIANDDN